MRYFVDTPVRIAAVRVALDQANGHRDVNGVPVPTTQYLVSGPATVDRDAQGRVTRVYGAVLATQTRTTSCTSDDQVILGDDGTAALELPDELDEIDAHLGKTVRGVAIPTRGSLATEAQLPARVKAEKDRRRAVESLEKAMGLRGR